MASVLLRAPSSARASLPVDYTIIADIIRYYAQLFSMAKSSPPNLRKTDKTPHNHAVDMFWKAETDDRNITSMNLAF